LEDILGILCLSWLLLERLLGVLFRSDVILVN